MAIRVEVELKGTSKFITLSRNKSVVSLFTISLHRRFYGKHGYNYRTTICATLLVNEKQEGAGLIPVTVSSPSSFLFPACV